MRWGLYKVEGEDECCGGEEKVKQIQNICSEMLKFDHLKQLYGMRMKRLLRDVPFFETAIALIRLSRKGLGEDELRRLLGKDKSLKKELRRLRYMTWKRGT